MNADDTKKLVIFIDDGWRYEKRDILLFLKSCLDFDIVTHDDMTVKALRPEFTVHKLCRKPVRRHGVYAFLMFFARELETNAVQYRKNIKIADTSWLNRSLHLLRKWAGAMGLRRYSYAQALAWYYRRSNEYGEVLKHYHTLLYMPVGILDKRVIFEAKAGGCKIFCWVYSWDNPMKDNEFLTDADRYLVWNEETKRDMCSLHCIPESSVEVVGPVQLDYLRNLDWASFPAPAEKYVLYACATGMDAHLAQEVQIVLNLRQVLDEVAPDVALYVRPYPFRFTIEGYEKLRDTEGITVLDFGRVENNRILITAEDAVERIKQIHNAICFVNLGSTIGLEASYTVTPMLQLAFNVENEYPDYLDIAQAFKNEHLKYLIRHEYINTVHSNEEVRLALQDILSGKVDPYMAYTQALRAFADPLGGVDFYRSVLYEKLHQVEHQRDKGL